MRILVIPSWYITAQHPYTGIYVKEQCEFIKKKGLEVHLMFADLGPAAIYTPIHKHFSPSEVLEDGLLSYRMPGLLPPKNNWLGLQIWLKCYDRLFRFYIAQQGLPNIIHAHSYLAGYLAAFLKKKYQIPYVLTEHSSQFIHQRFSGLKQEMIHQSFTKADELIAVSEGLKSGMQQYTDQRITIIPNLVDTALFQLKHEASNADTAFKFIFIGSLIERKNPLLLIEAFTTVIKRGYQQLELNIIGQGPLYSKLKEKIVASNLDQVITIQGEKTLKETANFLSSANALVLPSSAETFGVVVIEAMACGIPVIATRCGGPEYILDEDTGILIEPNNVDQLTKAMEQLYLNYQHYNNKMIREKAIARYGGYKVAAQLIDIYKNLV